MAETLALTLSDEFLAALATMIRHAVVEELTQRARNRELGFLDVNGAAAYVASTSAAIRSLVKRDAIPHYKAPNGRLLFDRDQLDIWVRSG